MVTSNYEFSWFHRQSRVCSEEGKVSEIKGLFLCHASVCLLILPTEPSRVSQQTARQSKRLACSEGAVCDNAGTHVRCLEHQVVCLGAINRERIGTLGET